MDVTVGFISKNAPGLVRAPDPELVRSRVESVRDYVVATGVAHSVRECVEIAFDQAGVEIDGHVRIDESLIRPAEVDHLVGDASKAKRELGWEPRTSFEQLTRLMVDADLEALDRGRG